MKKLIYILLLFSPFWASAQQDSTKVHLSLISHYQGDSVLLRWAPDRAGAWSLLLKTGYTLQRSEVSSDTSKMRWVNLHSNPILPEPLDKWKHFKTEYPLIAAQAIYGKTFAQTMMEKSDELSNRYSYTLLASDLDFTTARFAGLAFVDKKVEANKQYVYRLMAAQPLKKYLPVDTAYTAVSSIPTKPWDGPGILKTDELERKINIYWISNIHSAFYIERSEDGKNFKRLNQLPFVPMKNPQLEEQEFHTYSDTLVQNYKKYWYRIIGIDAFGILSPPGEVITAMSRDKTPPPPAKNLQTKVLKNGTVELTWEADSDPDLAGFSIGRSSENSLSGYELLTKNLLPKTTRRYIDTQPYKDKPNYYIVLASDTAKNASASMASLMVFADTTAPATPTGLKGSIDSLGILTLRWNPNTEKDLKGYIVYYSNDPKHIFTAASDSAIAENFFIDSLSLITLTEDIYFKVRAVDFNHNRSAESEVIKVSKPDKIPPAAPQFSHYTIEDKKVSLHLIPSSSTDVVEHQIFRRKEEDTVWKILGKLKGNIYVDTSAQSGSTYFYMAKALDDAQLLSPESAPLRIQTIRNLKGPSLTGTKIKREENKVILTWIPPKGEIKQIVWYKAVDKGGFETFAVSAATDKELVDTGVEKGKAYEYTSKVFYKDGRSSGFSPVVKTP